MLIGVTQQVLVRPERKERLDALDQKWHDFLARCGLTVLLLPNDPSAVQILLLKYEPRGFLLTGGNDLADYGGDAPERDSTERKIMDFALAHSYPLMGVCRGMQFIQHSFGIELEKVEGHSGTLVNVQGTGGSRTVNSYHRWGTRANHSPLNVLARASDNVVKAIGHKTQPIMGIMWHPERQRPFEAKDIKIFSEFFKSDQPAHLG